MMHHEVLIKKIAYENEETQGQNRGDVCLTSFVLIIRETYALELVCDGIGGSGRM